jgi:REP element-mobilizing transposase RayT
MDSYKFIDGVFVYFVTFTVNDWLPVFINPEPIEIINNSLNFCHTNKQLRIHAYVIMPNHIHLIISDADYDNERLGKTLADFRKFTGNRLADYIDANLSNSLAKTTRSKQLNDRVRQLWQPGWHAEALATKQFLRQKINYIHENPVRKGFVKLPEHWRHSSAGYWLNGENAELPIVPFGQA